MAKQTDSYAIEIENLHKSYKDVEALKGVTFKVPTGTLFSYIGLNGSGKSTTINILCQVIKSDAGSVKIFGKDIEKYGYEIKKDIGIVFQNSCLDRDLSIKANLKIKADIFGISKGDFLNKVEYLDSILELKSIYKKKYKHLSGGQKRRADIALALVNEPKLLFLDEPTTGLDPINRDKVWKAIMHLVKDEEITVFLTTHYMEEAEYSDNVIIIDEGKIIAEGTPIELKEKFSKNTLKIYVEETDNNANKLKEIFNNIEYDKDHYSIKIDNMDFLKVQDEDFQNLLKDIEIVKGNLQDVFINIAGKRFVNE